MNQSIPLAWSTESYRDYENKVAVGLRGVVDRNNIMNRAVADIIKSASLNNSISRGNHHKVAKNSQDILKVSTNICPREMTVLISKTVLNKTKLIYSGRGKSCPYY